MPILLTLQNGLNTRRRTSRLERPIRPRFWLKRADSAFAPISAVQIDVTFRQNLPFTWIAFIIARRGTVVWLRGLKRTGASASSGPAVLVAIQWTKWLTAR